MYVYWVLLYICLKILMHIYFLVLIYNCSNINLFLGSNIILPVSSPQGLLKTPSNLFPHHGFPPLRPPSQVSLNPLYIYMYSL